MGLNQCIKGGSIMDGIQFTISQAALVTLSGVIGMIVQRILFGSKASKPTFDPTNQSRSECIEAHNKNDLQHADFYRRIASLETNKEVIQEVLKNINSQLEKISRKLDV